MAYLSDPASRRLTRICSVLMLLRILQGLGLALTAKPLDLGPDGAIYLGWIDTIPHQAFPWPCIALNTSTLLYILVGAVVRTVFPGSLAALRLFNLFLFAGVLYISFLLIRRVFGERAAWIGTTMLSLDDLFNAVKSVQYEMLLALLVTAGLYVFLCALETDKNTVYFGSGIVLGLACLTQTKFLPLPALLTIFQLAVPAFRKGRVVNRLARMLLLVCIPAWLIGAIWPYRHYRLKGQFVLSNVAGFHLYLGNNPYANGTLCYPPESELAATKALGDEQTVDRAFKKRAVNFIRENPGFVVGTLWPRKMYYLFELFRWRNVLWLVTALLGMVLALRQEVTYGAVTLLTVFGFIVGVHLVIYGWGRYRFPALSAIHGFAGYAFARLTMR
jgi:hypothetical protein